MTRILPVIFLVVLMVVKCSSDSVQKPSNKAPYITSPDTLTAIEGQLFRFSPAFVDKDGPDTVISFVDFPSWLSVDGDRLSGTPGEGTKDTGFVAVVSDGLAADTLHATLKISAVNNPPQITSASSTEAAGGIYYRYRATFTDPDGPIARITFEDYPAWLTAADDSLYGTPPDGLGDAGFNLIVSDTLLADTLAVAIKMNPCIIVYGDSRTGHTQHQQLVDLMLPMKPTAVFHTGDLVENGLIQAQWDTFNLIIAPLRAISEFYPALGNHENQSPLFFSNFTLPNNEQWYSVERNRVHFIVLNSCVAIDSLSEQYQWLKADLASIPDSIRFIIPLFHHPPYSTGNHTEDEMGLRTKIVPLFQQYGVDIVFNGHDHDYERSYCGGIYYVVAGGGGAPLRPQARSHPCSQLFLMTYHFCKLSMVDNRLIVKVYDINSQLIDQFEVLR